MIGTLLSMRYYAKQPWQQAFIFFAVYFLATLIAVGLTSTYIGNAYVNIIVAAGIFIGLAHKWYGFALQFAVTVWLIAVAIDFLIGHLIGEFLVPILGSDLANGIMPVLSFV